MYLKTQEIGQRDNFAYHWTLKMCDDLDKTTLLKSRSANLLIKENSIPMVQISFKTKWLINKFPY